MRRALEWVGRAFGDKHPLATQQFETDGVDLFIQKLGMLLVASREGAAFIAKVFRDGTVKMWERPKP